MVFALWVATWWRSVLEGGVELMGSGVHRWMCREDEDDEIICEIFI